ncbi:MAG: formylglycine-generating enzyme family protein, partial [Candidatus Latescibacterota bacterium]|nr:formylglycine-generating enzyme family protein [Candidatus Latescibacterota bacterium]
MKNSYSLYVLGCTLSLIVIACGMNPSPVKTSKDGSEMRLITGGTFSMGSREGELGDLYFKTWKNYLSEKPLHKVTISSFYLDTYEITNAQYDRFLETVNSSGDRTMDHELQPSDLNHERQYVNENLTIPTHPVVGINWFDAYAYCKWAEKRLPTEAEWEYAARGGDGVYRTYPWGNAKPNHEGIWRANYYPEDKRNLDGWQYTSPPGSFPDGISPFGIQDMAGNAEEWVQDWVDFDYY